MWRYAYSVVMDSVPAAMTATQIERESAEDPLLSQVRHAIREDKWADLEHTVFKSVRDELCVIGQVLMKGSRIVLPQKMQKRALVTRDTKVWKCLNQIFGYHVYHTWTAIQREE